MLLNATLAAATVIATSWYGLNPGDHTVKVGPWRDSAFISAAQALAPSAIRFPSGTGASYWNWSLGCEMPCKSGTSRLEDFKVTLDATGAEVVFVLNMLTDTLDSQLRFLAHAASIGIPVSYVELGNEVHRGRSVQPMRVRLAM